VAAPATQSLSPAVVEPLLAGRFGRPYVYRQLARSTVSLFRPDDPEGTTAVCEEETEGHGCRGSPWVAPAGTSILASVLLRPSPDRRVQELSLTGATAVADAVEEELKLTVQIKWPSDVMVNRYRVAAVRCEPLGDAIELALVINVNQTTQQLPRSAPVQPASLRTIDGRLHDRARLLAAVLLALERSYDQWLEGGLNALYGSVGARDFLRGRRVSVDGMSGVAVGIDRAGRLEIDAGGRRRVLDSGAVKYAR
jgi:BirA family transcriptional regulator, biotin operon repressor / biotin---[acetyl-CoA-carboxylase] ligase